MTEAYKPIKLPMQYETRSAILHHINKYVCCWGQMKISKTTEGKVIGVTAPLWVNPSPLFFKLFSVLTLLCSLIFVGCYVYLRYFNNNNSQAGLTVRNYANLDLNVTYDQFMNQTNQTTSTVMGTRDVYCIFISQQELSEIFVLIGGIILFANFFHTMYLGFIVDYLSDIEWSRNLTISVIIWLLKSIFIIIDFVFSVKLINYYGTNYSATDTTFIFSDSTPKCITLFQVNMYGYLIVAVLVVILAVLQLLKIIQLAKKFFMSYFVEHSARCEDENIVVIQ